MSRRRVLTVGFVIAVLALVVIANRENSEHDGRAKHVRSAAITAPVHRTGAITPTASPLVADAPALVAARGRAIGEFRSQLVLRLQQCAPLTAPVAPRAVQFVFEHDPRRSTPDLQFMSVSQVHIIDIGGIAKASRECVERTLGMPLVVAAPALDGPRFAEIFHIPLS